MGILIDNKEQEREALRTANAQVSGLREQIQAAERALASAMRNGRGTLAKHSERVNVLNLAMQEARRVVVEREADARATALALHTAREQVWDARLRAFYAEQGVSDDGDVLVSGRAIEWDEWRSGVWQIKLLVMDPATGKPVMERPSSPNEETEPLVEWPKERFGYRADVYGPSRRRSFNDQGQDQVVLGEWRDAQVNWGSIGGIGTADARDLVRVHTLGIRFAEYLDAHRDEWMAADASL